MRTQPSNAAICKPKLGVWGLVSALLIGPALGGESLEERVQRYWTARSANDLQTVYNLESGSLPGGGLTPDQYRKLGGLPIRNVEILETRVDGVQAEIKIKGQVAVGSMGWMPQTLRQKWVLINGEWYHQTPKP